MTGPCGWLKPLREWLPALVGALGREPAMVRVALAAVRGSAPREAGVGMLVGRESLEGTIGGGQLEWLAIEAARAMLAGGPAAKLHRLVLGADVGQCCGGVVEVWMERFDAGDLEWLQAARSASRRGMTTMRTRLTADGTLSRSIGDSPAIAAAGSAMQLNRNAAGDLELIENPDIPYPPLWLYGAGHVGQALVRILAELPVQLTWIDSRREMFPAPIPGSVRCLQVAEPEGSVSAAPPATRFLVMTHSHSLDFLLCRAILARRDFAWAGLIGSKSKAARFRSRLLKAGAAAEAIARLVCPIGVGGIDSKWPAAIAVAVAAELLRDISSAGALAQTDAPAQADRAVSVSPASVSPACGATACAGCDP